MSDPFSDLVAANKSGLLKSFSLKEYLEACAENPMLYATAAQRLKAAIGERQLVDTSKDARLNRIFGGATINRYPTFSDFYGLEHAISRIVGFLEAAAQGHRQERLMLFLVGPPSSGKSSLAARLLSLMEVHPYYVLKAGDEVSPIDESPLGLFTTDAAREMVSKRYNIPSARLGGVMSLWAFKHLEAFGGDVSKFEVVEVQPSLLGFRGVAKVEPSSETMTGSLSAPLIAGLEMTTQGVIEIIEIFKHNHDGLTPLLTATEERKYTKPGFPGVNPYGGIIIGHSNDPDWKVFKETDRNAGLLDRIVVINVLYCMSATDEERIYRDALAKAGLTPDVCAPGTLTLLRSLGVLSRLSKRPEKGKGMAVVGVYDGKDPSDFGIGNLLSLQQPGDGKFGLSPRFLTAALADTLAADINEGRADPVRMFGVLEVAMQRGAALAGYTHFISDELMLWYLRFLDQHIREAYFEDYAGHIQARMKEYITYADAWVDGKLIKDPETEVVLSVAQIALKLNVAERQAGMVHSEAQAKQFRDGITMFSLRAGAGLKWSEVTEPNYSALARGSMRISDGDLFNRINFESRREEKEWEEHKGFVKRMGELFGYTERQVRHLVDWYIREAKLKASS